jgi:hypothetical protein
MEAVGQRFLVSDPRSDLGRITPCGISEPIFERRVALAEEGQLRASLQDGRKGVEHNVSHLLICEAAYGDDERNVGRNFEPEFAL